jgi:hypothetical protein
MKAVTVRVPGVNKSLQELFRIYREVVISGTEDAALKIRRLIKAESDKTDGK